MPLAHAKLAHGLRSALCDSAWNPGALDLARGNYEQALALDRRSWMLISRKAFLWKKQEMYRVHWTNCEGTRTRSFEPEAIVCRREFYSRLNRWADAEQTFHRRLEGAA